MLRLEWLAGRCAITTPGHRTRTASGRTVQSYIEATPWISPSHTCSPARVSRRERGLGEDRRVLSDLEGGKSKMLEERMWEGGG